jgi:hypothetical protein
LNRAQWEADHGLDPAPSFAKAEDAFRRCEREFPNLFSVHCNLAETLTAQARYGRTRGRDPSPLLAEARTVLARGDEVTGFFCVAAGWLAAAAEEAQWTLLSGGDPAPPRSEVEKRFSALRKKNPSAADGVLQAARASLAAAESLLVSGADPASDLDTSLRLLAEVEQLSPGGVDASLLRAEAALLRARSGDGTSWATAEASFASARRLAPASARVLARSALFYRFRIGSPAATLRDTPEGDRLAREALAIDPASAEALLLAGYFAGRSGRLAEARALLARGTDTNPLLPRLLDLRTGAEKPREGIVPRRQFPPGPPTGPGGGRAAPPSP